MLILITRDQTKEQQNVVSIEGYRSREKGKPIEAAVAKKPMTMQLELLVDFYMYKGDIFSGSCGTNTDHNIVVINYGNKRGEMFWIINNSWDEEWREDGYMRMKRDVGTPDGLCDIYTLPIYCPTM